MLYTAAAVVKCGSRLPASDALTAQTPANTAASRYVTSCSTLDAYYVITASVRNISMSQLIIGCVHLSSYISLLRPSAELFFFEGLYLTDEWHTNQYNRASIKRLLLLLEPDIFSITILCNTCVIYYRIREPYAVLQHGDIKRRKRTVRYQTGIIGIFICRTTMVRIRAIETHDIQNQF